LDHRAVLFDLDGTLLDTLDDLADSMNAVLRQLGFPPHPTAPYKYFVGDGVVNLVVRALPEAHRDEATVARAVTLMRHVYGEHWADKTRPYPGIPELLDALAARRVKMAVLSNKPDDSTKLCVARLLPRWRFDAVIGQSRTIPPKPDLAGVRAIIARLGVPAAEFLYLGDTNTDMATANAAGMFAVGALWGFRSADELRQAGARVLLSKPVDLLDLL
jgi:phosphoglycolate phosphatase